VGGVGHRGRAGGRGGGGGRSTCKKENVGRGEREGNPATSGLPASLLLHDTHRASAGMSRNFMHRPRVLLCLESRGERWARAALCA